MNDSGWIQTYTGRRCYPLAPRVADLCVTDIAHALANLCRFTGHVQTFYSVGEHSVRVADALEAQGRTLDEMFWGLMHDASEAYLQDLPRPLKHLPEFATYRAAEERMMRAVAERFGLPWPQPACVDHADKVLLATEARDLMPQREVDEWAWMPPPLAKPITPWTPPMAEQAFLARFDELQQRRQRDGAEP